MIGQTIFHYKIIEEIGRGGMGVVYKAEDTKLKRTVALKFLPPDLTRDPEAKKRFIQEAQTASALQHNNICTIHEINETEDEQLFLSMDCYDGVTLKEKLEKGPLSEQEAINIAAQTAQGLAKAHEKGIVHRDIKPANIMITEDGVIKILDFGLAKLAGQTKLTKAGSTLGTVAYMSPEQALGDPVDQRTDIWSLGVLFYEMLTGQMPYKGEYDHAVIYSIQNEEAEKLSDLKPDVSLESAQIVEKALIKEANGRYQQVNDLLIDIKRLAKKFELGISEQIDISGKFSFFKKLYQKRVPQILAFYFVFVWLLVQLVEWISYRFLLSPHIVNFTLFAALSLTPALFMLVYFNKTPKRQNRFSIGKLGVSLNLVASIMILFMGFGSKDLTTMEESKIIEDDNGNLVEIKVPKLEFCKSIAIFPFENTTGDTTYDWLQRGIDHILIYDLVQDQYLDAEKGYLLRSNGTGTLFKINRAGYTGGVGLPLKYKKDIAEELFKDFFLSGSFSVVNDTFQVNAILYNTYNINKLAEYQYTGPNIFDIVDSMSVKVRQDIEIPPGHIETTTNLPVTEIFTESMPAFKAFINGYIAFHEDKQDKAEKNFLKSIDLDSTISETYYFLGNILLMAGKEELCRENFSNIWKYRNKLPEYLKLYMETFYISFFEGPEKAFKKRKRMAEKFPNSLNAHLGVASFCNARMEWENAISEYEIALEIAPENNSILQKIGKMYSNSGNFDRSLEYYQNYVTKSPDDIRAYLAIAETYKMMGEHEKAKESILEADLIENGNYLILCELAKIESCSGNYDQAINHYKKALSVCKNSADSSEVYNYLSEYYYLRGQLNKTFRNRELYYQNWLQQPTYISGHRNMYASDYIKLGQKDKSFQIIRNIEMNKHITFLDRQIVQSYLKCYLALQDAVNAEKQLKYREENFRTLPHQTRTITYSKGKIYEIKGKYDEALLKYQEISEKSPADIFCLPLNTPIHVDIGRTYRKLNDYKKAEKALAKTLKVEPFNPEALYEMALIYWEWNKKEDAFKNLNNCLYVWENADPEYIPAQKARAKLSAWQKAE